jgi:transposase
MAIVTVGIDLAKNVFAVHGVDATGRAVLVRSSVARSKLLDLVASLPPCLIGMEACSGAHHWARLFAAHGHTVRLMAPKFVVPYRLSGKRGKNDGADAAAICEAVGRPNMRFVPVKSLQQQGELLVHRARQGFVVQRTATLNRIRGLLSELGIVLPLKAATVRREAMRQLEDLPGWANTVIGDLLSEVSRLDERIAQYDRHIQSIAKESTPARQLMQLPGVGATTNGAGGHDRARPGVSLWPPAVGLAGPGARPVQLGRQAAPGPHYQGRRPVSAHAADPGCARRAHFGQGQERRHQPMGGAAGRPRGLLEGHRGHRREERPYVLGRAGQRREFQAAGLGQAVQ